METISIYTDGSCATSDRVGGWAYVAMLGDRHMEAYGFATDTTINVMELTAILKVLERINDSPHPIRIFSDSQYAVNCINIWAARWHALGWFTLDGNPVANAETVKLVHQKMLEHRERRAVTISWVKGHNANVYNDKADYLAGIARRRRSSKETTARPIATLRHHYASLKGERFYIDAKSDTGLIVDASHSFKAKKRQADMVGVKALYRISGITKNWKAIGPPFPLPTIQHETNQDFHPA